MNRKGAEGTGQDEEREWNGSREGERKARTRKGLARVVGQGNGEDGRGRNGRERAERDGKGRGGKGRGMEGKAT